MSRSSRSLRNGAPVRTATSLHKNHLEKHERPRAPLLGAPAIGANSSFIVQGPWTLCRKLTMMQAGVARTYIYWRNDQQCVSGSNNCCAVQFNTYGLIDATNAKKASYCMVDAFRSGLATMPCVGVVASGNPSQ